MTKTDTVIRNEGMQVLMSALGYVDAERFIMLMNKEPFDYTKWRQKNLADGDSVRDLSAKAMKYLKEKEH